MFFIPQVFTEDPLHAGDSVLTKQTGLLRLWGFDYSLGKETKQVDKKYSMVVIYPMKKTKIGTGLGKGQF